eukprot:jgi/Ulvmu1/12804/UM097_0033.1
MADASAWTLEGCLSSHGYRNLTAVEGSPASHEQAMFRADWNEDGDAELSSKVLLHCTLVHPHTLSHGTSGKQGAGPGLMAELSRARLLESPHRLLLVKPTATDEDAYICMAEPDPPVALSSRKRNVLAMAGRAGKVPRSAAVYLFKQLLSRLQCSSACGLSFRRIHPDDLQLSLDAPGGPALSILAHTLPAAHTCPRSRDRVPTDGRTEAGQGSVHPCRCPYEMRPIGDHTQFGPALAHARDVWVATATYYFLRFGAWPYSQESLDAWPHTAPGQQRHHSLTGTVGSDATEDERELFDSVLRGGWPDAEAFARDCPTAAQLLSRPWLQQDLLAGLASVREKISSAVSSSRSPFRGVQSIYASPHTHAPVLAIRAAASSRDAPPSGPPAYTGPSSGSHKRVALGLPVMHGVTHAARRHSTRAAPQAVSDEEFSAAVSVHLARLLQYYREWETLRNAASGNRVHGSDGESSGSCNAVLCGQCPHTAPHTGRPGGDWTHVSTHCCDQWCWVVLMAACLTGGREVHTVPISTTPQVSKFAVSNLSGADLGLLPPPASWGSCSSHSSAGAFTL